MRRLMLPRTVPADLDRPLWRPTLGAWPEHDGVRFRVWAPASTSVEVVYERLGVSASRPLEAAGDGTFTGWVPGIEAGTRYRYRLDGDRLLPDPASRFQPEGVRGPSEVVNPSYEWSDEAWPGVDADELVIYELHVGTFTSAGTFSGVESRLDYLRHLGVTAIEIMPVAEAPGRWNWGYDGVFLFAPSHNYGSPRELQQLVDAAHRRGLAVLLDVVYNHVGPDGACWSEYTPRYFTDRHHTPWGAAVNLDGEGAPHVREFLIQNALHWIHEYHIDGLRLDATHALHDDSARPFLGEIADAVHRAAPQRRPLVIAEDDRRLLRIVEPPDRGGFGLDAVWADDFHHEVRRLVAGDHEGYFAKYAGTADAIARTLECGGYFEDSPDALSAFVLCLQNHDQIGNRAFGDRLHHTIDEASYRAASALLLCAPETPLLFMGQEWAASSPFCYFTDHGEELGRAVTNGRRNEFAAFSAFRDPERRAAIPDPQDERTFLNSRLNWGELDAGDHARTFRLYQALLALRRSTATLRGGRTPDVTAQALDGATVVMQRQSAGADGVMVVSRLVGRGAVELPIDETFRRIAVMLTTEDAAFASAPRPPHITVRSRDVHIRFDGPATIVFRVHRSAGPR